MTTSEAQIQAMLNEQKSSAGKLHYSESASTRLAYKTAADLLTTTDCSGNFIRLYRHFAGALMKATYTGNLIQYGTLITTSKAEARVGKGMLDGDGVLFDFVGQGHPTHIAMYAGNGKIWNHGGPNFNNMGPDLWDLSDNVDGAHSIWVVRYLEPTPKEEFTVDQYDTIMAELKKIETLLSTDLKATIDRVDGQTSKMVHGVKDTHGNDVSLTAISAELKKSETPS